jgi:hypothetical protein
MCSTTAEAGALLDAELRRLREIEDAARAWRRAWAALDDAPAAVARRRKARERLFAALDRTEPTP